MKIFCKYLTIIVVIFSLTSCSSYRPILERNATFLETGEEKSEQEIDACKKEAEETFDKYKVERAAKEAGRKAVIGGVVGAATGAIFARRSKSILTGGLIGAGIGAAIGALSVAGEDKVKPDHMKQRYMSNCLAKKGYSVIGWR